jgi:hypothetical protein
MAHPTPKDINGHKLQVGDRVSYQETIGWGPKERTCTGVIQSINSYESPVYRDRDKGDYKLVRYERVAMIHTMVSPRSPYEQPQSPSKCTFISHGKPFSQKEIKAAKARREQMKKARPFKPGKAEYICYVLAHAGVPMNRVAILRRVHALEGSRIAFKEGSNADYFNGTSTHYSIKKRSVVLRGLIRVSNGKRGEQRLFVLTAAGKKLVAKMEAWMAEG